MDCLFMQTGFLVQRTCQRGAFWSCMKRGEKALELRPVIRKWRCNKGSKWHSCFKRCGTIDKRRGRNFPYVLTPSHTHLTEPKCSRAEPRKIIPPLARPSIIWQLCQITKDVPDDLRDCIGKLHRESDRIKEIRQQEDNDNRVRQCIDHLEKLGEHALHVCQQAGNTVDEQVQKAVRQAHDFIS
jgi:hypothetical protein